MKFSKNISSLVSVLFLRVSKPTSEQSPAPIEFISSTINTLVLYLEVGFTTLQKGKQRRKKFLQNLISRDGPEKSAEARWR